MFRILSAISALIVVVGFAIWVANLDFSFGAEHQGYKRLSGTVAEGFVYRSSKEPFPRATCKTLKMGKVKLGPFSVGPLSTLTIEDLIVNLPPHEKKDTVAKSSKVKHRGSESALQITDFLGLNSLVEISHPKAARRFSKIVINGLELNRMEGAVLRPVLRAARLESQMQRVILKDVIVYCEDREEMHHTAELVLNQTPRLIWPGGEFVIDAPHVLL